MLQSRGDQSRRRVRQRLGGGYVAGMSLYCHRLQLLEIVASTRRRVASARLSPVLVQSTKCGGVRHSGSIVGFAQKVVLTRLDLPATEVGIKQHNVPRTYAPLFRWD